MQKKVIKKEPRNKNDTRHKTERQMAEINPEISIIAQNVNGLNSVIKGRN